MVSSGSTLMHAEATTFWREHGDRAQMVSWAACCGVDRPAREALGRWKAGSSDEYIRTSRTLVLQAQATIATRIREHLGRTDVLGEAVLLQELHAHLVTRGWSPSRASEQTESLRVFAATGTLPSKSAKALKDAKAEVQALEDESFEVAPPMGPYVVSISRRAQARCLHYIGKCWRKPGVDYVLFEDAGVNPSAATYQGMPRMLATG